MTFLERLDLSGRRLLVAGGGTLIGRAVASFAARCQVGSVVMLGPDEAELNAALEPTNDRVPTVSVHPVALNDLAALTELAAEIESSGPVDLLVNVTARRSRTKLQDLDRTEWDAVAIGEVKRVFAPCRVFVPRMAERGYGRVVNVVSIAGKRGSDAIGGPAYAAAHGAINGLTKALAREFAGDGVRVNAVNRGVTDSVDDVSAAVEDTGIVPLGRAAAVGEVGAAAVYLLSDASAYVTGETLNVDGGMAME